MSKAGEEERGAARSGDFLDGREKDDEWVRDTCWDGSEETERQRGGGHREHGHNLGKRH